MAYDYKKKPAASCPSPILIPVLQETTLKIS